ncbi:hypothetical protein Tco_1453152, partial [Tanacetum coccineum]
MHSKIELFLYKMRHLKGMSYEDIRPIFEKKRDDSSKPAEGRRKKTLARKRANGKDSEESMKKQKLEDDTEKEDLKDYLDIIPGDDVAIDIESLDTKYPIVDCKTYVLAENFMYYQFFRAEGSSKNYNIFSEMLDDFDRQDGDLKTLFEPDEEDEVWRNQQGYNLISWRLYDSCGIHILLIDNGITIHMMIEKKYPLNQKMLSRMLSKRLEVDHECTMAYELLRTGMSFSLMSYSTRACFIHNACWHALPADTYSASVVEMASAVCFLENQDVRQQPMKVQTPL